MTGGTGDTGRLSSAILIFYLLFVFGSAFSRAFSQIALGIALVLFMIVAVQQKYNPFSTSIRWFYILAGCYIGWLLLSGLMSRAPLSSIYFTRKEWLFAAVPVGVFLMQSHKNREWLVWALAIGISIVSLYAVSQYITGWDWLNFANNHFVPKRIDTVSGNFSRPNTFAGFFSVAAMFLLAYAVYPEHKWDSSRKWLVAISILAMVSTLLSFRRGPVIYLIISLLVMALLKGGRIRGFAAALAILLALMTAVVPSLRERFSLPTPTEEAEDYQGSRPFIWNHSLTLVAENPLFGVGNGIFIEAYREIVQRDTGVDLPWWWRHGQAHNDFLNTAAIGGLPCLAAFAGIWFFVLRKFARGIREKQFAADQRRVQFAALLGSILFLLTSLTVSSFADEETHELIMFIWAFGLATWYNRGSEKPELVTHLKA
ncbi:MAG: O-antigen ligase family protein [Candidatus Zixiibacteriota bacterium]